MERPPVRLTYASPRTWYAAEHRYRRPRTLLGIGFVAFFAFAAGAMTFFALRSGATVFAVAFGLPAAALLAAVVFAAAAYAQDARDSFRITEHGIDVNGRTCPWGQIAQVGGERYLGGVRLFYVRRGPLVLRRNRRLGFVRERGTFPAVASPDEFVALGEELRQHLNVAHPHVIVDRLAVAPERGA